MQKPLDILINERRGRDRKANLQLGDLAQNPALSMASRVFLPHLLTVVYHIPVTVDMKNLNL